MFSIIIFIFEYNFDLNFWYDNYLNQINLNNSIGVKAIDFVEKQKISDQIKIQKVYYIKLTLIYFPGSTVSFFVILNLYYWKY